MNSRAKRLREKKAASENEYKKKKIAINQIQRKHRLVNNCFMGSNGFLAMHNFSCLTIMLNDSKICTRHHWIGVFVCVFCVALLFCNIQSRGEPFHGSFTPRYLELKINLRCCMQVRDNGKYALPFGSNTDVTVSWNVCAHCARCCKCHCAKWMGNSQSDKNTETLKHNRNEKAIYSIT